MHNAWCIHRVITQKRYYHAFRVRIDISKSLLHARNTVLTGTSCTTEGEVKLVNGSSEFEGRVEVCHEQEWYQLCDDKWDTNETRVLCHQLGSAARGTNSALTYSELLTQIKSCTHAYSFLTDRVPIYFVADSQPYGKSLYGAGDVKTLARQLDCEGIEENLLQCSFRSATCDDGSIAGASCSGLPLGPCDGNDISYCCSGSTSFCKKSGCFCDSSCRGKDDCCSDINITCPIRGGLNCSHGNIMIACEPIEPTKSADSNMHVLHLPCTRIDKCNNFTFHVHIHQLLKSLKCTLVWWNCLVGWRLRKPHKV